MLTCANPACNASFPMTIVVDGKKRNLCNRRFCTRCVPFGSRKSTQSTQREPYSHCSVCRKPNGSTRRRRCGSCNTKIRRYRTKKRAIELLGGKCKRCGWSGHQAGFDFHHVDGKDFAIGDVANRSWSRIVAELRRCELLCAICHRIEHSTREDTHLIAEAEKYGV